MLLLWILALGSCLLSQKVIAQVKVLSPAALVEQVRRSTNGSPILPGTTATFGTPTYGKTFTGHLYRWFSPSQHCEPDYGGDVPSTAPVDADDALNYTDGLTGELAPPMPTEPVGAVDGADATAYASHLRNIFIIERGGCTFAQKVEVASKLHADAVIFVDTNSSSWQRADLPRIIIADDGRRDTPDIPSILLVHSDGQMLLDAVKKYDEVLIQLQWSMPKTDLVMVDFWTTAGSFEGRKFLKEYAYHASKLRRHMIFTPHYIVYSLRSGSNAANEMCWDATGELCCDPPDTQSLDPADGYVKGKDVLLENLRQLCLWEATAKSIPEAANTRFSEEWWEYVRREFEECPVMASGSGRTPIERLFSSACSQRILESILNKEQLREVFVCSRKRALELLRRERDDRAWGVNALRINGARFAGNLSPRLLSHAICSAFTNEPAECTDLLGPHTHIKEVHKGYSAGALFFWCICVAVALAYAVVYLRERYTRKSMRAALRHEVMLEVRNQLEGYQQVPDTLTGNAMSDRFKTLLSTNNDNTGEGGMPNKDY